MASVFEDNNLFNAFDSVHGSSAGAGAAAYFSAGQSHLGASIYYEDVNNRKFIDAWRPFRLQPTMNVGFLIDEVMRKRKPLKPQFIFNNPGFLRIVATDARSGQQVVFDRFRDEDQLYGALKGSMFLPLIAGKFSNLDGRKLIDGGLVQQIAVSSAIAAGATHVIVLMTRRRSELKRPVGGPRAYLDTFVLRRVYGEAVAALYKERSQIINGVVGDVLAGRTAQAVLIDSIAAPDDSPQIGRLTTDKSVLLSGLRAAQEAARRFLDGPLS
jgi:predicted patatin/cPLA2 family phospholipase